jgi:hypothetical protein
MKTEEYIVSEESAKEQLAVILDYCDIEQERLDKLKEKGQDVERKLIRAIREGRVEVEVANGFSVTQTLENGKKLVYGEITGLIKHNIDGIESFYDRIVGILAALSGNKPATIHLLKNRDLTVAESLGILFLGH